MLAPIQPYELYQYPMDGAPIEIIPRNYWIDLAKGYWGYWRKCREFQLTRIAVMLRIWLRRAHRRLNQVRIINAITLGDRENRMSLRALYGYT